MRVADSTTVRNYLNYLDQSKTNYATTNLRIASGDRFTAISDDVSAGTRVLRVRADKNKAEEYYSTVKSVDDQLSVTENAVSSINTTLATVHTKILKAETATTGDSGRATISKEIDNLKSEVLSYLNTKYNNSYALGGSGSATAPFTVNSDGKLAYNGYEVANISYDTQNKKYVYMAGTSEQKDIPMDSDVYADIGLGLQMKTTTTGTGASAITTATSDVQSDTAFKVSYSGLEVIGLPKDGTTAAGTGKANNIYDLLTNISTTMQSNDITTLGTLDKQLTTMKDDFVDQLTDIGTKTSYLDSVKNSLETKIDSYTNQISNLMGIDDAKEATNQTLNDYVLKAVLSMGSKILPVSLMDYVK